ncbi:MAG: putative ABC transporter substrate binding protein [Erysipelotrichaceae bacterium]|nr:MAG: putative ABC transporter substrate binding [Erysipelotrichaceae bacterium]TXT19071.1 MAG: putative ABC transporter substrate binding protein [Erysipelotrichaceae bacterium]
MTATKRTLTITLFLIIFLFSHAFNVFAESLIESKYSEILKEWENLPDTTADNYTQVISASQLNLPIGTNEVCAQYENACVLLQPKSHAGFELVIPKSGYYTFVFDYANDIQSINPPEIAIKIDGRYPFYEMRRIIFPHIFFDSVKTFAVDRYGNDTYVNLNRRSVWLTNELRDPNFSEPYPFKIYLEEGTRQIDIEGLVTPLYLGNITIKSVSQYMSYNQYRAQYSVESAGFKLTLEAEHPTSRNTTSVVTANDRSLNVTPYDSYRLLMNTLGGSTWSRSGAAVSYEINAPQDGLYQLSFFAIQNTKSNYTVYRKIKINGVVPFEEANAFPFKYIQSYKDVVFANQDKQPYQFFLNKGINTITLEATVSPYNSAIQKIDSVLKEINALSLEIKKLVGNQDNPYKEWIITDYIPDLQPRLVSMADRLQTDLDLIVDGLGSKGSAEALSYKMAIDNLRFLAETPNKVPNRMNRFSVGSGSVAQLLGTVLPLLQQTPLAIDKFTVYSPNQTAISEKSSFFDSMIEGIKRFIHSFTDDPYATIGSDPDEIEVWVNRPRQYVDLLQSMVDETFTPKTGIKIKFSIMPNESKLVLANAANIQPDVALGVSTDKPYELAIRGALYDLRRFDDFDKTIGIYSPGALLSFIINDSVYAIPETQDFWVTFYRKDILSALGIPVPHTWDEVLEILPELQRYGMNFNTALSSGSGMKGFLATAPYLFNQGASLYSEDGFSTNIGSEEAIKGIRFMAESFTIYGMPLTTSSFYNSFRYGEIPVGISNLETYVKLLSAAPEIAGQWDITLYPAIVLEDGTENRYTSGAAQTSVMFKKTKHPNESWRFMKWWMSTETQTKFQDQLILRYGPEYIWSSANLEAFANNSFSQEHKDVILEQWQWLQEPVKLPGSYMLERELSNVWNKIVFDGVNPRVAIDRSVILVNREITRKMEEFGYLENGVKIKEYNVPTIEKVKGWIENAKE